MSLHPLDPEVVRAANEWFYTSHPRGQELRGPDGDTLLHPTSDEDAAGRSAWVAEYRRLLGEKQSSENDAPPARDDQVEESDPLTTCIGCCPTDFLLSVSETIDLEAESSVLLIARDVQPAGAGLGTFSWSTSSDKLTLERSFASDLQTVEGDSVSVLAGSEPNLIPELGELIEVTRSQSPCAPITKQLRVFINQKCKLYTLSQPKIIAIATDGYLTPSNYVVDPLLPSGHTLGFGQDFLFSLGRAQPYGPSQGTSVSVLDGKMRKLLVKFAGADSSGKARRLFDHFLAPQTSVMYWQDASLTSAAEVHENIVSFVSRALSAPNSPQISSGKTRIHQALMNAGWDINSAIPPTDLGVPAFNQGSPTFSTGDFDTGLGVMINGIQYGIVVAKEYHYDQCKHEYYIKLEYVFYDVFGLDDGDLNEYGANGWYDSDASQGITAWWQLQHQHGYAPVITRIAFEREFTVPV